MSKFTDARDDFLGVALPVAGGVAGFFLGGPAGAAVGTGAGLSIANSRKADQRNEAALSSAEKLQKDAAEALEAGLSDWTESGRHAQNAIDKGIYEVYPEGSYIVERDEDGNDTRRVDVSGEFVTDDDGNRTRKAVSDFEQEKFNPKAFESEEFKRLSTFTPPADFNAPAFRHATFNAPTAENLKDDPGYQFRVEQGIKARDRSASSRGNLNSGAQQLAIERFAQGSASQEYGNAYARAQDKYAREHGKNTQDFARNYGIEANRYNLQLNKENDRYGRVIDEENNLYAREAGEYNTESNRLSNQYNVLNGQSARGQASAAGVGASQVNLANNQANNLLAQAQSKNQRDADYAQTLNQGLNNWLIYNGVNGNGNSGGNSGGNSLLNNGIKPLNSTSSTTGNDWFKNIGPPPVAGVSLSNSDQRRNYFA